MRSLSETILFQSVAGAELFTSQGREMTMSYTQELLVDDSLDFVAPYLPVSADNEFWSQERAFSLKPPEPTCQPKMTRVRSLFLSDLHLGFRHSRVQSLLEFLNRHEPETTTIFCEARWSCDFLSSAEWWKLRKSFITEQPMVDNS